jgi:hypothetical protein
MTHRERILAAIRGQQPDRLPFAPRLEFWYRARLLNGTLPEEVRGLSIDEISDYLGVARYAVVPDYTHTRSEYDDIDAGLAIHLGWGMPYETRLENVERRVERTPGRTRVEYRTPLGSIATEWVLTDEMLNAGVSVPWVTRHAIEKPEDFAVAGYVFRNLRVIERQDSYLCRCGEVGERGLAVAQVSGSACPVQHIMKSLMTVETFFYALNDEPAKLMGLAEDMEPFYAAIRAAAANSAAELVLLGGNYDDAITYPPFFRRYILPALQSYAETLHARGKLLMTHTDGENRKLMGLYREANFDVADSVCPKPMTSLSLDEILESFEGRIAIWGGIPSVLLCRDSATDAQFRHFIDEIVERYTGRTRLVLGVSDMVTADAEWDRLLYMSRRICG